MATDKKNTSAEVQEETKAEETKAEETVQKKNERVEVHIPKAIGTEDPNFFCAVNGVTYLLPRGKRSMVPAHVAAEIERSFKAQDAWDEKSAAMAEAASK